MKFQITICSAFSPPEDCIVLKPIPEITAGTICSAFIQRDSYICKISRMMIIKLKIFLTNWINLSGIFLAVYLSTSISGLIASGSARIAFLGGLFGIIFSGSLFWAGFIISMLLLDFILMNRNINQLNLKLFIEWAVVSGPFIYWFVQSTQWIFLVAIVGFL